MSKPRANNDSESTKRNGSPGNLSAEVPARVQMAGFFYVSTRYDINQHFHNEQVEWIDANVDYFEAVVIAGHHFLWLDLFFEAWFRCWPENEDSIYCATAEANDIVDRKKNILRILTMCIEVRWNQQ